MSAQTKRVHELTAKIAPILAHESAPVQGAVIGDLLAIWLAGHVIPGEFEATQKLRADVLEHLLVTVRKLIPINFAINIEPKMKGRRKP